MANTTFQLKRSVTTGIVPNASQLSQGELAINLPDHRLFTKDESNSVVDVFGQSVNTTANVQFNAASFSGNVSATGSIVSSNAVSGTQLISTVAQGTRPLQVTSTTLVANLNADLLDGQQGSWYQDLSNATGTLSLTKGGTNSSITAVAGALAYSTATGLSVTASGNTGQFLISSGANAPTWTNAGSLAVGYAWTVNNGVYTTGSYSDPAWITSLSASKVGLGNVTNESKATMFSSPTFTGSVTTTGNMTVGGNLTVQGTQFVVSTNNTSYTSNFIDMHAPVSGWVTSNDGKDIGLVFENYDPAPAYQIVSGGSANGSVATLSVPRGGAYFPGAWISISGAAPAEFNGTFKVTATTGNTFSFGLASSNTIVNAGRATRITEIAISGGTTDNGSKISTVTYTSPALALNVGDVLTITGCVPSEYNGTWTVLSASVGSFTFQNLSNALPITTNGVAVLSNRRAFLGWSNDEHSLEYYKIGSSNPNGTFTGIYGTIKGAMFHAAPAPATPIEQYQNGMAFRVGGVGEQDVWDVETANGGSLGQVKVVAAGVQKLNAQGTGVVYANAATIFVTGAPLAGNNVTITNPYAIQVASGKSLFGGNVQVYGTITANDFNVAGNLVVSGTTTYINSNQLNIGDNIITLNADVPGTTAPIENAGLEINRGSSANVSFYWDETLDRWTIGNTYVGGAATITGDTTITGNVNVNSGVLYVDTTNARVGINKTSPGAPLHIVGGGGTTRSAIVSNGSYDLVFAVNASVGSWNGLTAAGDAVIYSTNNTQNNGNLVIGTWSSLAVGHGVKLTGNTYDVKVAGNTFTVAANTTVTGFVNASASVNSAVISVGTAVVANATGVWTTGAVNAASHTVGTAIVANTTGLFLNNAGQQITVGTSTANAYILWAANGVGAPSITSRSAGTKLVLSANVGAAAVDYAIGMETSHLWFSVADITNGFKWYANTVQLAVANTTGLVINSGGVLPQSNTVGANLGSSAQRWNLYATAVNVSGTSTLGTLAVGNTTITGTASVSANLAVNGALTANDVVVTGNLSVTGTTTYINTTQLNIGDNIITLNADLGAAAPTEDAGFTVNRGTSANVSLLWNEVDDRWELGNTHIFGNLSVNNGTLVNLGNGALYVNTVSKYVGISNTTPSAPLTIGAAGSNFTNPIIQFAGNANSYIQINGQNANAGNNSSTDLMFIADNGTDTTNYIDLGINNSTYNQPAYGLMKPNSGYLFVNGGDLTIGTQTYHDVLFHTGNTIAGSVKAGLYANGNFGVGNTTPGDRLSVQGAIYTSAGIKIGDDLIAPKAGIDAITYSNETLDVSGQETAPTGLALDETIGTRLYVIGTTNRTIYQYTLSAGFSLSTATYANKSFSVNTQDSLPQSLYIRPDGLKAYVAGAANGRVYEYSIGTAWDISTSSFAQFFSVATQTTTPRALSFSEDGTKMVVGAGSTVYRYNLSTAWNISTAVFVDSLDVSAYETDVTSVDFDETGASLFVVGSRYNAFIQYNLSVAYSLASAAYVARIDVGQVGGYDIHTVGEARGSTSGQFAYTVSTDLARVFAFTATSPAAQLTGSRFIADTDFHIRNQLIAYETAKFADGLDSYGDTKLHTTKAGNTTIDGSLTVNAAGQDITLNGSLTGNVIVGGAGQTGYIQIGRSTSNQTVSLANGATVGGSTKIVEIGTGGQSGSNTTVNIGSAVGGGSVNVNQLLSVSNSVNISGSANISGGLNVTGSINRNPVITTTLTGDLAGTASIALTNLASNTLTITTTLANTTVAAGTYGNSSVIPQITVDSKGRVTGIANIVTVAAGVAAFDYSSSNNTLRIESSAGYTYATITTVNTFSVSNTLSVTGTTTLGAVNASGNVNFDSGTLFVDASNNRVGVGNTTPATSMEVAGNIGIGGRAVLESAAVQTTSTTQTVLTSFSATTYGCAKLLIQATRGGSRDVSEVLVTHDGVTAYATEYGSVRTANAAAIYSLDVDVSGSSVRVLVTSSNSTSTLYKATYTLLGI